MSVNGKNDGVTVGDLLSVAQNEDIRYNEAKEIIERIQSVSADWYDYCEQADVSKSNADTIKCVLEDKRLKP